MRCKIKTDKRLKILAEIKKRLIERFGFDFDVDTRKRNYFYVKCIYYKASKEITNLSHEIIADSLNAKRDHATVTYGLKTFDNIIVHYEPLLANVCYEIIQKYDKPLQDSIEKLYLDIEDSCAFLATTNDFPSLETIKAWFCKYDEIKKNNDKRR